MTRGRSAGKRRADAGASAATMVLRVLLVAALVLIVWRVGSAVPGAVGRAEGAPALVAPAQDAAAHDSPASPVPTIAASTATVKGTAGLTTDLASAFAKARAAARAEGVTVSIRSGRRTTQQQQALFDQAVVDRGSVEEAAKWVLPPERSGHVAGTAIDVAPTKGARWLAKHGTRWGLCLRYANEPWHFELRTEPGGSCPALEPNAAG